MHIHKLKFTDRQQYLDVVKPNQIVDEEIIETQDSKIYAIAIPFETGIIPNPIEYDEEGNALEQTFKEGYHVDVMTTEVIQEWKDYTVTGIESPAHQFGYGEVVKAEDFVDDGLFDGV